ncbi:dynamin family protein [Ancylothrix sp. C2]|uniref:dynamin family protein n=1 Tax=Ancylothrix sp. D3o TaxID=2953691 RepID=UPI0021BBA31F|nr:dynamin family protein [Ancylothrix sp. D3o]MCT7952858.1 dynamin family protein [Ancylothrix sp. D3o]
MTDRQTRITGIIEKRRPLAQKIAATDVNLRTIAAALENLEAQRHQLIDKVNDPTVAGRLEEINFSNIQAGIFKELEALGKLKARFSRDTLNIGVVGRMRQGKSTLLQSLTGLGDDVIPARSGGACTAVRSIIRHRPLQDTQATISFYSEESLFKEVILPYYQALNLTPIPINFDDFVHSSFSHKIPGTDATKEAIYKRLKSDFYTHRHTYRPLLGAEKRTVSKEQIKDYVTHSGDDNQLEGYKNLAVREVEIYCSFPNPEVGKIALVDIPGLGDLKLGDEALMLETLGREVDVVLFVRRPDPIGDAWKVEDTDLYNTAVRALRDLPQRSFMVINELRDNPESTPLCQKFKQQINQGTVGIKVVECLVTNCQDKEKANQLLDRVLDYLANHIATLDNQYANKTQQNLLEIEKAVKAELEKAQNAFGEATMSGSDFSVSVDLFKPLIDHLKNRLTQLLNSLRQQRENESTDFKDKVLEVVKKCRSNTPIPSIEQIEFRANALGGIPNAYYDYLNKIRADLSQQFLCLDDGLKLSLNRVKSQVAEVLIKEGKLEKLAEEKGAEFIKALAEIIPAELIRGKESKLKLGFKLLADFELSYRGLVQHRIRQHLDVLTPNDPKVIGLSASPPAEQVLTSLKTAYAEAVYNCENSLEEFLCEPSQAAFAIVEEFLDRIFRAEGVEDEWRVFLYEWRSEVWPEEFKQLGERSHLRKVWLDAVEKAAGVNQSDTIQFLN